MKVMFNPVPTSLKTGLNSIQMQAFSQMMAPLLSTIPDRVEQEHAT